MNTLPYPKADVIAACRKRIGHIRAEREEAKEKLIRKHQRPPSIWNWWSAVSRDQAEAAARRDRDWYWNVTVYQSEVEANLQNIAIALEHAITERVYMTYGEFSNIAEFYKDIEINIKTKTS